MPSSDVKEGVKLTIFLFKLLFIPVLRSRDGKKRRKVNDERSKNNALERLRLIINSCANKGVLEAHPVEALYGN